MKMKRILTWTKKEVKKVSLKESLEDLKNFGSTDEGNPHLWIRFTMPKFEGLIWYERSFG